MTGWASSVHVRTSASVRTPSRVSSSSRANRRCREFTISSHTAAEDVGKIATMARAKTLVLTHFVPGDMDWITDAMWHDAAAKNYSGEIIVGHDLQSISLG